MTSAGEARKSDPSGGSSSKRGRTNKDERRRQEEDGSLLSVVDSQGHLCGFFTLAQIQKLPERCEVGRFSATVKSQIDPRRRVDLLKASQESPSISAHQRMRIANEIGFIRQHPDRASEPIARGVMPAPVDDAKGRPTPKRTPKTPGRKKSALEPRPGYRYITRDEAGLYLGVHTIDEVRAICPTANWIGPAICVPGRVNPDELAALLDGRYNTPDIAASKRLLLSAGKALERERNAVRDGTDPHISPASLLPKKVLHKSSRPVCTVPLATVEAVFGRGWFLVDDSAVQLVTTFYESDIALMGADAQRRYEASFPVSHPNTKTVGDASTQMQQLKAQPFRQTVPKEKNAVENASCTYPRIPSPTHQAAAEGRHPEEKHLIARDAKGLYLGIHKLGWARSRTDGTRVDAGVIVLPEALPTRNATSYVNKAAENKLQRFNWHLQKAIRRSEAFMSDVPKRTSEEFWSRQDGLPVEVHELNGRSLGSLTPPQLRELVGNGWFLVSSVEAQLMTPVDDDTRERIQEAAARTQAAIDARSAAAGKAWEAAARAGAAQEAVDSRASHSASPSQGEPAHEDAAPTLMRVMADLVIGEAHSRAIYDQITLVAQYGFRSKLTEMLRKAFPTEPVRLPSGRELYNYHIANALAQRKGQRLTREDRDFVLLALDDALTESERAEEEERQATEEYLEQAAQHKHAVSHWVESTLRDTEADVTSRELAEVFERRQGVVLVMPDGDLYRSVLSTEMADASYASAIPYLPFSHFIVRIPGIAGVYGFGVVRDPGGSGAKLIAIPEGERTVRDAGSLLPFFERVLFFICAGRGLPGSQREYFDQPSPRAAHRTADAAWPARGRGKASPEGDVVRGRSFDVGMRVIFLTENPSFRPASASGVDIRPHAVAGTTYVMSNGTEVARRPYWNHGSGNKRNSLPPEIVERNIRYRDESRAGCTHPT